MRDWELRDPGAKGGDPRRKWGPDRGNWGVFVGWGIGGRCVQGAKAQEEDGDQGGRRTWGWYRVCQIWSMSGRMELQ